jgi:hypothetical protein
LTFPSSITVTSFLFSCAFNTLTPPALPSCCNMSSPNIAYSSPPHKG